jgi:hypothetical protein
MALSVQKFLAKNKTPVLSEPSYGPYLSPADLFCVPEIGSWLKRILMWISRGNKKRGEKMWRS